VGETVHHDTARPSVTSIVQSAVEVKFTDAVPPSCARTGAVDVTSIFGFSSGLGVGVGVGISSPPEPQLQQQTIIVRSKMRSMFFIFLSFKFMFIFLTNIIRQNVLKTKKGLYSVNNTN
jgi:hypothetical protein